MPRRSPAQRAAIARAQTAEHLARPSWHVPGLTPSWAERHQPELLAGDFALTEQARLAHPAVRWWWGARQVGFTYGAWCYLCEALITTWDRKWGMPAKAGETVLEHRDRVHPGRGASVRVQRAPPLAGSD